MEKISERFLISTIVALLLLGAGFVIVPDNASAAEDGDFIYTVDGSPAVATVTGYTGAGGAITIPSTLGGYPTAVIGDWAFANSALLTSVIMPNSVMTIGAGAFSNCTSL